jgi:hypothetical protein
MEAEFVRSFFDSGLEVVWSRFWPLVFPIITLLFRFAAVTFVKIARLIRGYDWCYPREMGEEKNSCSQCGHAFSSHIRNVFETPGTMRVDDALMGKKKRDIFSDRPAGESGCTECACRQWKPAGF